MNTVVAGKDNFSDTTAKTARMKMIATTPTWRSTRTSSVSSEEDYDKISHTKPTKQIAIFKVTFDRSKIVLIKKAMRSVILKLLVAK